MVNDKMIKTVDIHLFRNPPCFGEFYYSLLDYAFEQADYFMLAWIQYGDDENGVDSFSKEAYEMQKLLSPYIVKTRNDLHWPGSSPIPMGSLKILGDVVFYKTCSEAKQILKRVSGLYDWVNPDYPQDLAFFKRNKCWFYSVAHEKMAFFIRATAKDAAFLTKHGVDVEYSTNIIKESSISMYDEDSI